MSTSSSLLFTVFKYLESVAAYSFKLCSSSEVALSGLEGLLSEHGRDERKKSCSIICLVEFCIASIRSSRFRSA